MRIGGSIAACLVVPAFLGLALTTACYAPRIESCRDPIPDASDFGALEVVELHFEGGDHGGNITLGYRLRASIPSGAAGARCVSAHSELWRDGTLLSTIETPVTADVADATLTTSLIYHYRTPRSGLTLRVSALGQSIEIDVDDQLRRGETEGTSDAGTR